ncbi:hypothetical protein [Streptomyces sp. SID3343]|uniref:hypothetical protein n=1 Tax=Streptomyces sp. SID3343 TaxID=2690260 RepID=UPI00136E8B55|nr:hypothetical protein [Streptomyces sp. SID3343]MYW00212.1 hypothetical protein [Streptomyces sp. SID3343]
MTEPDRPHPADIARLDRTSYSHSAILRLLLQEAAAHAADRAIALAEDPFGEEPGDLVARAVLLADRVRDVLEAAVVVEREAGTSWRVIGAALPNARTGATGVSAQAAEGTYGESVREWSEFRADALATGTSDAPLLNPGATLTLLRAWADLRCVDLSEPGPIHPSHEIANLLALTTSAVGAGWTGERLALVYDRRAAAWDRLADLLDPDHRAGAVESAAADRARAADLRAHVISP